MLTTDNTNNHSRYELRNRYVFRGRLVMQTALHIGGGRVTLSSSDSPVVLTPDQKPFIPGSSFKGALRSTVEKMIPSLPGFSTCALFEVDKNAFKQLSPEEQKQVCSTARQWYFTNERRQHPENAQAIATAALDGLCDSCNLFGSPFAAALLNVNDLYMPSEEWSGVLQTRDGVAIDRDTEKARDRLKYDFEVVPASATFNLEITLENATPKDVQLVCVGLSEYLHGYGVIGGKRSRGLGVARLEDLKVSALELNDNDLDDTTKKKRLRDYLVKGAFSSESNGSEFLDARINEIFE